MAPLILYALLGTLRQLQVGPTALISLLTGQALDAAGFLEENVPWKSSFEADFMSSGAHGWRSTTGFVGGSHQHSATWILGRVMKDGSFRPIFNGNLAFSIGFESFGLLFERAKWHFQARRAPFRLCGGLHVS